MPRVYVLRPSSAPPDLVAVRVYKRGAIIDRPGPPRGKVAKRGDIGDMSLKSRLRAAWRLENAPRAWGVMITLTFPTQPARPKEHFARWRRRMADVLRPTTQWAWLMEFQERGVIHFHVFIERDSLDRGGFLRPRHLHRINRSGKPTDLVHGPLQHRVVTRWLDGLPGRTPEADRFNWGGIVEVLRSPDAAARYVAREAGKRVQKQLPAGVEKAGRWFWVSPAGKPVLTSMTLCRPEKLPPWKHVYDAETIVL